MWFTNSSNPLTVIPGRVIYPGGFFVTRTSDVYIVSEIIYGQVDKLDLTTSIYANVAVFCTSCYDLFMSSDGILYCSMHEKHQIATKLLDDGSNSIRIVAGVGFSGKTPSTLTLPRGIFVNNNQDLYVADCFNHRIQLFKSGQFTGITVAEIIGTTRLNYPTTVMLDADDHLYIVDTGNHRIIRSEPNGFRCIVGCSSSRGSASYELSHPINMAFDKRGNIYVADGKNSRIQKFFLLTNICSEYFQIQV